MVMTGMSNVLNELGNKRCLFETFSIALGIIAVLEKVDLTVCKNWNRLCLTAEECGGRRKGVKKYLESW